MLAAGFDNLAGQPLCNFDRLGNAAPFRYKSRNIRASAEVAPILEGLDPYTDGNFLDFCHMHLTLHGRLFTDNRTTACLEIRTTRSPACVPHWCPFTMLGPLGRGPTGRTLHC